MGGHAKGNWQAENSRVGWRYPRMPNPNLDLLEMVANRLRPVLSEIVFVGGCYSVIGIGQPAGNIAEKVTAG
jgi:hypothetical protein